MDPSSPPKFSGVQGGIPLGEEGSDNPYHVSVSEEAERSDSKREEPISVFNLVGGCSAFVRFFSEKYSDKLYQEFHKEANRGYQDDDATAVANKTIHAFSLCDDWHERETLWNLMDNVDGHATAICAIAGAYSIGRAHAKLSYMDQFEERMDRVATHLAKALQFTADKMDAGVNTLLDAGAKVAEAANRATDASSALARKAVEVTALPTSHLPGPSTPLTTRSQPAVTGISSLPRDDAPALPSPSPTRATRARSLVKSPAKAFKKSGTVGNFSSIPGLYTCFLQKNTIRVTVHHDGRTVLTPLFMDVLKGEKIELLERLFNLDMEKFSKEIEDAPIITWADKEEKKSFLRNLYYKTDTKDNQWYFESV